jgi:hypothetical protein
VFVKVPRLYPQTLTLSPLSACGLRRFDVRSRRASLSMMKDDESVANTSDPTTFTNVFNTRVQPDGGGWKVTAFVDGQDKVMSRHATLEQARQAEYQLNESGNRGSEEADESIKRHEGLDADTVLEDVAELFRPVNTEKPLNPDNPPPADESIARGERDERTDTRRGD